MNQGYNTINYTRANKYAKWSPQEDVNKVNVLIIEILSIFYEISRSTKFRRV